MGAQMNARLSVWNQANADEALKAMIACCGALRWAEGMVKLRPIHSVAELSAAADRVWSTMEETDWMEAFACHPRIGGRETVHASKKSAAWSRQEQSSAEGAANQVLAQLAAGNELYEQRFGFTYIVCATGKNAEEMLAILNCRLVSDQFTELREAAEQQRQITQIRLGKWLVE
jgi:2-oxo-4-hydroxy-4-carboxy-5-ureidoimidazoline decarboxylase